MVELDVAAVADHDLRHEGTSRLSEAGFSIEQVAMVTGHRDWKMLKRYANLRPEDLRWVTRKDGHSAAGGVSPPPSDSKHGSVGTSASTGFRIHVLPVRRTLLYSRSIPMQK